MPSTECVTLLSSRSIGRIAVVGAARALPDIIVSRTIAPFPQESWRDPNSNYLRSAHHDVPWHELEFISVYRRPVEPEPLSRLQVPWRYARYLWRFFDRDIEAAAMSAAMGLSAEAEPLAVSLSSRSLDGKDALDV